MSDRYEIVVTVIDQKTGQKRAVSIGGKAMVERRLSDNAHRAGLALERAIAELQEWSDAPALWKGAV